MSQVESEQLLGVELECCVVSGRALGSLLLGVGPSRQPTCLSHPSMQSTPVWSGCHCFLEFGRDGSLPRQMDQVSFVISSWWLAPLLTHSILISSVSVWFEVYFIRHYNNYTNLFLIFICLEFPPFFLFLFLFFQFPSFKTLFSAGWQWHTHSESRGRWVSVRLSPAWCTEQIPW